MWKQGARWFWQTHERFSQCTQRSILSVFFPVDLLLYYYGSNKSTGLETGKSQLCAVHKIWIFFWPKVFFWSIMKMPIRKNIHNMSQCPPNPGFMQEKVQKGYFLKKDSWELKFFCCFKFLWISRRPGTLN